MEEEKIARDDLRQKLQAAGVVKVKCEYEGEGDSGGISYINLLDANGDEIDKNTIDKELVSKISKTINDHLDSKLGGYGNDDGGYGYVYWDLSTDDVKIEHYEVTKNYEERNGW